MHADSSLRKWVALLPVALVVTMGFAVQACGSEDLDLKADKSSVDPSCRPATCSTLAKNCGIVSDGCGGQLRCGTCAGTDNDCRSNVCERGCESDSECGDSSACINGSCSDKCSESSDCPSGQSCQTGVCRENAATSCRWDSDCRADERCSTEGFCVGTSTGNRTCSYNSQCRGGETCRNGRCENLGSQSCRYHSDCDREESCLNGYCSSQNSSCRYDNDCPNNSRCSYGVCTGSGNGNIRAQCISRGVSIGLGFIDINISREHWFYDSANSTGKRVDDCECRSNETLIIEQGDKRRSIGCSVCDRNGDDITCYN